MWSQLKLPPRYFALPSFDINKQFLNKRNHALTRLFALFPLSDGLFLVFIYINWISMCNQQIHSIQIGYKSRSKGVLNSSKGSSKDSKNLRARSDGQLCKTGQKSQGFFQFTTFKKGYNCSLKC